VGMVGLEEDWGTAVRDALIGGAAALGVGLLLGAGVAGGNRLAARRDLQRKTPGWVGLAPGEIYAVDSYFYGDGQIRAVRQATLEKGEMPVLRLALKVPEGPRNPERDTWDIAVPPRLVGAVTAVLPHLPNRSAKAPTQS
ncbi:MAG: hypothetical protein KC425_03255, partial [Anaerolineales bacterium]|nr:hypothetical protein [Anaerolineales bacterium]